jgi:SAM-dependent methyltransferase
MNGEVMMTNWRIEKLLPCLRCLSCAGELTATPAALRCRSCGKTFAVDQDTVAFRMDSSGSMPTESANDGLVLKIKNFLKRYPLIFKLVHDWIAGPVIGMSPRRFSREFNKDQVVLNIGSGNRRIDDFVVNIDGFRFPNVDVVADIYRLPLADHCVDGILCNSVLEHLKDPELAVKEMIRILKPGGKVYIQTPFIHTFHSSPDDFYRWTGWGLERLWADLETVEKGVIYGPTGSMVHMFSEWMGILLSFGSQRLYQVMNLAFLVITGPIRWLDLLLARLPYSGNGSHIIYHVARKATP